MLALTEQAVSAVQTILASSQMPEGSGMRISRADEPGANSAGSGVELHLTLVESPQEGDQVVTDPPVFLEPEAAEVLDDKVLHAEILEDQVRFTVAEQTDSSV
jgi:Fe-S cluster assembly iron-binding protein IscA